MKELFKTIQQRESDLMTAMRKERKKIFVDLDGVLANFVQGAIKLFNLQDVMLPEDICSWDIANEVILGDYLKGSLGKMEKQARFWNKINRTKNFWLNLKPFTWNYDLTNFIKKLDPKFKLCTSHIDNPNCLSEKAMWVKLYLNMSAGSIIFCTDKSLLAKSNHILLDDSDENISSFISSGGQGILFPQTWNRNCSLVSNRIDWVKNALSDSVV